jgi:hypothetical protein
MKKQLKKILAGCLLLTGIILIAGCVSFPTANRTVAIPASAKNTDLLELAIDAARDVGLPPATKVDKADGIVEFGGFEAPELGYAAQVRIRSDGQLDVTVKRGSAYISRPVDSKTEEFVQAIQTRLQNIK